MNKKILDASIGVDFEKISPETDEKDEKKSQTLISEIQEATKGLYYVSESDAEILPFEGTQVIELNKESLLKQLEISDNANIEEIDFTSFFDNLTKTEDWFGDEEKMIAAKFTVLSDLLQDNLKNIKVFKVGKINLDIYVVGLNDENTLIGIKTKAVET